MKTKHHGQMSESFLTAVFLSLSGGLQDAYTYLFRGKVFANAQTGNIVLLSANIMDGRWDKVLHYLVPLCAFALGVLVAEKMREQFQAMQRLHWRQLVVLGEVLLLFAVGFLPQSQNLLANAIVSFSCAMQVQAFRKVDGYAFASTMCIGDLRSGVEAFCIWRKTHEPHAKDRMVRYFGIILLFALGAGLGSKSAAQLGGRAIWISCCFLLVSFALMFIREELEENPVIEKDLTAIRQEPGCLAYDYYFSAQDENELLLIERWQSAEHQRVHMQQPHMARLKAIKEQNVDSTTLGKVRLEA